MAKFRWLYLIAAACRSHSSNEEVAIAFQEAMKSSMPLDAYESFPLAKDPVAICEEWTARGIQKRSGLGSSFLYLICDDDKLPNEVVVLLDPTYSEWQMATKVSVAWADVVSLEAFQFDYRFRNADIPTELARLPKLDKLILSHQLEGTFPTEFGRSPQLTYIHFHHNCLEGTLPTEIMKMTKMLSLNVAHNRLEGSIGPDISEDLYYYFHQMNTYIVEGNNLQGSIPRLFSQMFQLSHLDVGWNYFTGTIPTLSESLELCVLQGNRLEGTIPTRLTNTKSLNTMYLLANRLIGQIPRLDSLHLLNAISVAGNYLKGSIPSELPKVHLRQLDLSLNYLTGALPENLGKIQDIVVMIMHRNYLQGQIPGEIGELRDLRVLSLFRNRLTGPIPANLFRGQLEAIVLHDNMFDGSVPPRLIMTAYDESAILDRVLLTLFTNYLSCTLPHIEVDDHHPVGSVFFNVTELIAQGNAFSRGDDRPKTRREQFKHLDDSSHLVHPGRWFRLFVTLGLGMLAMASALVFALRRNLMAFVSRNMGFPRDLAVDFNSDGSSKAVIESSNRQSALMLLALSGISTFVLLPTFAFGKSYLECGDALLKTTAFSFEISPVAGAIAICAWNAHAFVVLRISSRWPASIVSNKARIHPIRAMRFWCGWFSCLTMLAIPQFVYVMFESMPRNNIIESRVGWTYEFIHKTAPLLMVVSDTSILRRASFSFSSLSGISSTEFMMVGRIFNQMVVPAILTTWLHEGCFGCWRMFYVPCRENTDAFDVSMHGREYSKAKWMKSKLEAAKYSGMLMTKGDVCHRDYFAKIWRRGTCTRAVIGVGGPLLMRKMALKAFYVPALQISLWTVSQKSKHGRLLIHWWNVGKSLWFECQLADLGFCCCAAVVFGPFVPALTPLLLLAVLMNFVAFRVGEETFGVMDFSHDDGLRLSPTFTHICTGVFYICLLNFLSGSKVAAWIWVLFLVTSGGTVAYILRLLAYQWFRYGNGGARINGVEPVWVELAPILPLSACSGPPPSFVDNDAENFSRKPNTSS